MSGTNPGAWPDDWHGDVDDGKRKAFAELDKTIPLYTAADLAKAREEGRRDGLEGVRKIMTYDETATSRGLGQGNTWDVIKRTYTIDADVFDALLAEPNEGGEDAD